MNPRNQDGTTLAVCQLSDREQVKVRQVRLGNEKRIDIRSWRLTGEEWRPEEGFSFGAEYLPVLCQALLDAVAATESSRAVPSGGSSRERVRWLARQVALARERLSAVRREDYTRPQDYKRVYTIRLRDLRRTEKLLREAQAGFLREEAA